MKKLKDYLEKNGIQKAWFARQIGIPPATFCQAMSGRCHVPVKCWKRIRELTNNFITWEDLYKNYESASKNKSRNRGNLSRKAYEKSMGNLSCLHSGKGHGYSGGENL